MESENNLWLPASWGISAENNGKCILRIQSENEQRSPMEGVVFYYAWFLIINFAREKVLSVLLYRHWKSVRETLDCFCARLENLEYFSSPLMQQSFQLDLCVSTALRVQVPSSL